MYTPENSVNLDAYLLYVFMHGCSISSTTTYSYEICSLLNWLFNLIMVFGVLIICSYHRQQAKDVGMHAC